MKKIFEIEKNYSYDNPNQTYFRIKEYVGRDAEGRFLYIYHGQVFTLPDTAQHYVDNLESHGTFTIPETYPTKYHPG